ncbi:glycosyltransferase family 1 protein [Chloroflexia bacterium SDU3-3]|nr:glycosyltransferase family 1 protein [Chloroflexia bacterium SDU3-3]
MSRMLLATHGTNGDVLPFIALGAALRARGHDVSLMTHAHYQRPTLDAGLAFLPLDTAEQYERQLDDSHLLMNPLHDPQSLIRFYQRNRQFEQMHEEFQALRALVVPGDTVIVARHTSGLAALMLGEATGAPVAWVALSPSQLMTLPVTSYMYGQVLSGGINQLRQGLGLPPVRDWRRWLDSPQVQLGLWPEWFAPPEPEWPRSLAPVGFVLHDAAEDGELPPELRELLQRHPHPVLITGGTGQLLHAEFYRAAVEACHRAGLRALLVTRHRELVPSPLPMNIHWFPALPFRTLMPQVGAVLHHGGMGTLARALWAGAPQLILADGADRPDNAARLHRLGLAQWAAPERWSSPAVVEQLASLATPEARQRCASWASQIAPAQSLAAACEHLEALLRPEQLARGAAPLTPNDDPGLRDRLRGLTAAQRQALATRLRQGAASAQPTPIEEQL